MKKQILAGLLALGFVGGLGMSSVTIAAGNDAVAKACKDKKAGDMVKVDGKDVKCPEKKK